MSIFKACDIRGVYQEELTPELAAAIGRGVGTKLNGGSVVVGGDVRLSTSILKEQLIRGLLETGCQITDLGTVPTPVFYFARNELGIAGGVMVTASHNPAKDNGFKVNFSEWPVTEVDLQDLEALVKKGQFEKKPGGSLNNREILPAYLHFIKESAAAIERDARLASSKVSASTISPLKVVIDCGNGCYSRIAPGVFRDLGYPVAELFCEPDGGFPNREPNPSVAANLTALFEKVKSEEANLGIAFDGDGDRVVFVDENGRMVGNDQIIALLARYFLRFNPGGKVVFDIKCSGLVAEEIAKAGGIPVMERSGHAFIRTTLIKEKAVLGGEVSGHFFFGKLKGDDGLFAALLVAGIVRESGGSIKSLVVGFPRYNITPDLRVSYSGTDRAELLEELAEKLAKTPGCTVSRLDGVRGEFSEGWGLVRISVTEPVLTFRFESKGGYPVSGIKDRFLEPVSKLKDLVDGVWSKYIGKERSF